MGIEENIKTVICSIELLIQNENFETNFESSTKEELLIKHLEKNKENLFAFLAKESNDDILSLYKLSKHRTLENVCWDFVLLCLLLLKSLNKNLVNQDDNSVPNESKIPKGILSLSQEQSVKKCFEFIIALGLLPNLIPSIRSLLERRTSMYKDISILYTSTCSKKQYYRLIACILILVDCLKQQCLQRIFLANYYGDLLLAFFQLCYAPLKKKEKTLKLINNSPASKTETSNLLYNAGSLSYNLSEILDKIDEDEVPDDKMLWEMTADRVYFVKIMSDILLKVSPSVLTWNLLLFQGINLQNSEIPHENSKKPPIWFKNICSSIITEQIMVPSGVRNFITTVLDKTLDEDISSGKVSNKKMDAVAKLIVINNVKHLPVKLYLTEICSQAFQLLRIQKTPMDNIFKYVASSIILHIIEFHSKLMDEFISHVLFRPFLKLLDNALPILQVAEEDIHQCIEDIHWVFVNTAPVLSLEVVSAVIPYFHLLFIMYVKLSKGILVVQKTKVEELLLVTLKNCDDDLAVSLFQLVTFEDIIVPPVRSVSHLAVDFGGGILVNNESELNAEDLVKNAEEKCDALFSLIQKLTNKKVKFSYFSLLLKRSSRRKTQNDDASVNDVLLSNLLEKLMEQIEDVMDDFDQGIELISDIVSAKEFAECGPSEVNEKVLIILSAIIAFKSQLTYQHWTTLKKCLPNLKKLMNSNIESATVAQDIFIAIQTHGAVMESTPKNKGLTPYASAVHNVNNACFAIRGGGLLALCKLLQEKDEETVGHLNDLLKIFKENLRNDDSYVYLSAIRGLSIIADIDTEAVISVLLSEMENTEFCRVEQLLKIGEVFVKLCQNLGELAVKYRNLLLNIFLQATKHENPLVRASGLSNLGELCQRLQFSIGPVLQEVLNCVISLLKHDSNVEVRRSSALALRLMVQGAGIFAIEILESNIKEVYSVLNHTCRTEKDVEVTIHCQLALDEINNMMKDKLFSAQQLQKEIRICDPFN